MYLKKINTYIFFIVKNIKKNIIFPAKSKINQHFIFFKI